MGQAVTFVTLEVGCHTQMGNWNPSDFLKSALNNRNIKTHFKRMDWKMAYLYTYLSKALQIWADLSLKATLSTSH